MPFHIDYRPQTFDEVVGNRGVIESLKSILARDNKPHNYLFYGPSGCGKTTLARLLAKGLGCDDLEFHELNAANTRGIDTIRETIQNGFYAPLAGQIKVFLFDEAHQITGPAGEALIKFLEDTPPHVYNILCTTNPEKIIKTLKNRCSTYGVTSLTAIELKKLLNWVLKSEGVTIQDDVIRALISAADGCPRRLLVMLDQVINIPNAIGQLDAIVNTTDESVQIIDICRKLIENKSGANKWAELSQMLKSFDQDPEQTRRAILGYMSAVLLGRKGEDGKRVALLMSEFFNPFYDTGKAGLITACYMACLV